MKLKEELNNIKGHRKTTLDLIKDKLIETSLRGKDFYILPLHEYNAFSMDTKEALKDYLIFEGLTIYYNYKEGLKISW